MDVAANIGDVNVAGQGKPSPIAFGVQYKDLKIGLAAGPRSADTDMGRQKGGPNAGICARLRNGHKPTVGPATPWANTD